MFIAGALGVVIFSAAQFTDAENTTSTVIEAGTIDLGVTSQVNCPVVTPGLEGAPGVAAADAEAVCSFTLNHTGSLPNADLYAQITVTDLPCNPDGLADTSEFCDTGADLSAAEFEVIADSLAATSALTPGLPGATSDFSTYLSSCSLIAETMPVDASVNGSFTIQLQQDRTSNVMQGDAIQITIDFELAEHGAASVDCDPDTSTSPTP
jgi:hypothetical protein